VIAFTNNNYKSQVRGDAFIKARKLIEKSLASHKGAYFVGVVGTNGVWRQANVPVNDNQKSRLSLELLSSSLVCAVDAGWAAA
jgi:hypothetical protein